MILKHFVKILFKSHCASLQSHYIYFIKEENVQKEGVYSLKSLG